MQRLQSCLLARSTQGRLRAHVLNDHGRVARLRLPWRSSSRLLAVCLNLDEIIATTRSTYVSRHSNTVMMLPVLWHLSVL